jgi:hypothetical protein
MFVYFIKTSIGNESFVKIGKANRVAERLIDLQMGCPALLEVLATIRCDSSLRALEIERLAHSVFADHHVRGEWFRLPERWQDLVDLARDHADFHIRAADPGSPGGAIPPFVTLEAWAKANGLRKHRQVLRRLAKLGAIVPKPVKRHRGDWYAHPKARLQSPELFLNLRVGCVPAYSQDIPREGNKDLFSAANMVRATGIEPVTPTMSRKECAKENNDLTGAEYADRITKDQEVKL